MEVGAKFYGPLWKKVGSLPPPGWEASSSLSRVVRVSEALRTVQGAVIPWSPAQEVWTPWGFFWVPLCFFQSSSAEFRLGCPGGAPKGSMRMDRHPPGEMRQSCGWVTVASANRLQCRLSNSCQTWTNQEQSLVGPRQVDLSRGWQRTEVRDSWCLSLCWTQIVCVARVPSLKI